MKNIIFISLFIALVSLLFSNTFPIKDYKIYNSKTGKELSLKKLAKDTKNTDVLFWGELHDDALIHSLEADILPLLLKVHKKIAISMEMFERDTQSYLNKYLNGEMSEKEFLKKTRAWPNYPTDYKPIIDFAKKHHIDVIAGNVPRRYASMINKQGIKSFENIPENEKKYVAKKLKLLEGAYKKNFIKTMAENMGGGNSPMMSKMFDNIFAAQSLKDDTMAESISEYHKKHPDTFIIHYNGDFHSNSHLGTAEKLQLLDKNLNIKVIAPVIIDNSKNPYFVAEEKNTGDYILVMHRFSNDKQKPTQKSTNKMFKNVHNSILSHKINIELNPSDHYLKGFDEITLAKPLSPTDTLFLISSLTVDKIYANKNRLPFVVNGKDKDYQSIIVMSHAPAKDIRIEYSGNVYNSLKGRELNQTHDSTIGIISDEDGKGIYLPGGSWYPYMNDELADYDVTASCPENISLITSGKETHKTENGKNYYHWTSELSVDNIALVGNKFVINEREVNGVRLATYLSKDNAKFAPQYLDALEKYLKKYSNLFGKYPFSSFSIVENFFASGFGMPNYTVLANAIVKMPFVTLSPGVIAHEFCHNWWGNSVYVDYQKGNWCEALTVFSSNYYWNILNNHPEKAAEWRKSAIMDINLLPKEKNFALKKFVYQHNDDEATIGYQKGAFFFITLFNIMGKDNFFDAVKDYYKTYKGKITTWKDIQTVFEKYNPNKTAFPFDKIFAQWLNETTIPNITVSDVSYQNKKVQFKIEQTGNTYYLAIPVKINYKKGSEMKTVNLSSASQTFTIDTKNKPQSLEIDPDNFVLKTIPKSEMPYSLTRTLNDKPLVILPEKGALLPRLNMVVSMLKRSGYQLTSKLANEVTENDLKNNSILILGSYENNSAIAKINYPKGFEMEKNKIIAGGKPYSSSKASIILSFQSSENKNKFASVYIWNSNDAITSFRKMFHYMNDSWQVFDLDKKPTGAIDSGQIFSSGKNPFKFYVK